MSWVNWHFKIWLCFPNRHFCFCHDNSTCIRFKENGLLLNTARRHYCTAPWWSVFDKPNSVCLKPHVFFQRTSMWFWILLCFYFCRFVLIQCLFFNASFSTFAVRFVFPICVSIFSFFQKLYVYMYIYIYKMHMHICTCSIIYAHIHIDIVESGQHLCFDICSPFVVTHIDLTKNCCAFLILLVTKSGVVT